jgi:hypothetical protein
MIIPYKGHNCKKDRLFFLACSSGFHPVLVKDCTLPKTSKNLINSIPYR